MTALLRECVNVWRKRLFNRTDHLNEDAGQNSKGNRHWEDQVVAGHAMPTKALVTIGPAV